MTEIEMRVESIEGQLDTLYELIRDFAIIQGLDAKGVCTDQFFANLNALEQERAEIKKFIKDGRSQAD